MDIKRKNYLSGKLYLFNFSNVILPCGFIALLQFAIVGLLLEFFFGLKLTKIISKDE